MLPPEAGEAESKEYHVTIAANVEAPGQQEPVFEASPARENSSATVVRYQAVVLENLFHFLRYFIRLPHLGPRLLWIDSICIDQTNLTERASQVGYMGDIFQATARVLVWHGQWEPTADVA